MKDPMFVAFLTSQIENARAAIANGGLELDDIIGKAQEIKKIEARIERINNPRTRAPKVEVVAEAA